MDAFLRALQGGQLPAGTRAELEARFGALLTDELIAAGLLVRGKQATTYPCPNLGACCPRTVVPNPGDEAYPFVAIPSDATHCCDAVRLTADDLATWTTSRARLVAIVSEHFRVNGPANLRDPAFPHAHRIGRAVWQGLEREVLLQIAVLRQDTPSGPFYTGELRIEALLTWLRERYGLHIDRLPRGDGFGAPSIEDRAALRENTAAFTARLREVGFYRDLSDAYVSQTLTPRYRIEPPTGGNGGTP